jgi:hypothetical protein
VSRRFTRRSGLTFTELMVAAVLMALLLSQVHSIFVGTTRAQEATLNATDALRSVLLVAEFLRYDVGRIYCQKEEDEPKVSDNGQRLDLVVAAPPGPDMNHPGNETVSYWVEKVRGSSKALRVMRRDAKGTRQLDACYLEDFQIRDVPPGDLSTRQRYLEVTVQGTDGPQCKQHYVTSIVIPVRIAFEPLPYELVKAPYGEY